jgi:RNA polymerase sigma factor (sigma-70 family)
VEEFSALLYRAQAGDLDAYGSIVRRFQDMAVGYANAKLGDFHLAEDVAQEAFIEAYLNLDKVYGPKAFPSWLRQIVFKYCDRIWRRRRVHAVPLDLAAEVEATDKDPAAFLDEQDLKSSVQTVIQNLPEPERTAINLFYISDLSQKEVAAFLDLPVSTVNFRLHSARKRLKKELNSMAEGSVGAQAEKRSLEQDLLQKEEELMDMAKENLQSRRPSKDEAFAAKVQEELHSFEKLHGLLLPALKELFVPALGRDVVIEVQAAHRTLFGYYVQSLSKLCCSYTYKMKPLDGWVHLNLSIPLAVGLFDPDADEKAFAAEIETRWATPIGSSSWISPAEIQTANNIIRPLIKALEAAWKPVQQVDIRDVELESIPAFIRSTKPEAPAIHLVLALKAADRPGMTLEFCYPLETLAGPLPALGQSTDG